MYMKDKLVKTNHKGSYYVMKKVSIVLMVLACFAFVTAVPTYIIQKSKGAKQRGLAEEMTSEVVEAETSVDEISEEYESYNN